MELGARVWRNNCKGKERATKTDAAHEKLQMQGSTAIAVDLDSGAGCADGG